jgi:hypothetical protein
MRNYIGVDNGVTGSIGILGSTSLLFKMPIRSEYSYTKIKQKITRVDFYNLLGILKLAEPDSLVILERPMVNPARFKASASALRCLEATLIAIEQCNREGSNFSIMYCDSKNWQTALLPAGCEKEDLKPASLDIGKRLFPHIDFTGFKDADSLLIAEWARRNNY